MALNLRVFVLLIVFLMMAGCSVVNPVELTHESETAKFLKFKFYILIEDNMNQILPEFSTLIEEKLPVALMNKGIDSEILAKGSVDIPPGEGGYLMHIKILKSYPEERIHGLQVVVSFSKLEFYRAGIILNASPLAFTGWDDFSNRFVNIVVSILEKNTS